MDKFIYFCICLLTLVSCNGISKKFDSKTWKSAESLYDGHRERMMKDLINNHLEFGMNYDQILEIIGEPQYIDECSSNKQYEVAEKYGKIDPIGYTFLELEFDENDRLTKWEIIETRFRE